MTILGNSCLSVFKIVLDYILYEALKWPQIAPFCQKHSTPLPPLKNYGVHTIKPQLRPCRVRYNMSSSPGRVKPKTVWLGIRIFCPSGVPSLPADCYFNEVVLIKKNTTKSVGLVLSRHHHLRNIIAMI